MSITNPFTPGEGREMPRRMAGSWGVKDLFAALQIAAALDIARKKQLGNKAYPCRGYREEQDWIQEGFGLYASQKWMKNGQE